MSELTPLPCCRAAALQKGREPSMEILCPSCQDYRVFMHFVKYPDDLPLYRPPAGFTHMTYKQITGKDGR